MPHMHGCAFKPHGSCTASYHIRAIVCAASVRWLHIIPYAKEITDPRVQRCVTEPHPKRRWH